MDRPNHANNTAAGNRQLRLGREPISIGRHAENKLVLNDTMASRFHCVIEKAPDGYLLRDLGASNGTLVNGRRVKSAILSPGDVVRVGSTDLVLVLPESELNPVDLDAVAALEQGEIIEQGPETLDESDIVDDTGDGHGGDYVATDEGPIAVTSDDNVDLGGDYEHALRQMAEAAWEKPFGETAITMLNPR